MKELACYWLALLCSHSVYGAQKVDTSQFSKALCTDTLEQRLSDEEIATVVPMQEILAKLGKKVSFDNSVYLVELASGLRGVFKPGNDCYAEVAAYRASCFVEDYLVPPTVVRTINEELGSLQLYVQTDIDLLEDCSPYGLVPEEQKIRMLLFYFVMGQWDRSYSNRLVQVTQNGAQLILIDNAGIGNKQQVRYGEYPYIQVGYDTTIECDWDELFPFDTPVCVNNVSFERAQELFGNFLEEDFLKRFWERNKKSIEYIVWRRGLWIPYYKKDTEHLPLVPEYYPSHVIEKYEELDEDHLRSFWSEAFSLTETDEYEKLIKLTLDRRDQLLAVCKK